MTHVCKRLVRGRRGMSPLQVILILAAAFVIVAGLKSLGTTTYNISQQGLWNSFFGS